METIEIPKDLASLRELLARLKDKEARLEADLAIREYPDLEVGVIKIVTALASVRKLDKSVSVQKVIASAHVQERAAAEKQLEFYKARIATLNEQLKLRHNTALENQRALWESRLKGVEQLLATSTPENSKFSGMSNAKDVAVSNFALLYREWEAKLEKYGVRMAELLPSVSYYLDQYERDKAAGT